jgi:hypothetical protein
MVFSGMLFGDSCPLFAQAAFMFDPNGDRVEDIVAPGAIEGTWSIYAGGTDCVVIAPPTPTDPPLSIPTPCNSSQP